MQINIQGMVNSGDHTSPDKGADHTSPDTGADSTETGKKVEQFGKEQPTVPAPATKPDQQTEQNKKP